MDAPPDLDGKEAAIKIPADEEQKQPDDGDEFDDDASGKKVEDFELELIKV